jgi:hypothetical protein
MNPGDADAIALLHDGHPIAHALDATDHLMARITG